MRLVIAALLALDFSAPARSQGPATEAEIRRDCKIDALRYCKAAILTAERSTIINCMIANKAKLSAACARHLW